jgi:hypothetical protein
MRLYLLVVVVCGIVAFWARSHAAAPPMAEPYQLILYRPKPPTPTDPVDVAVRADVGKASRWWGFVRAFELVEKDNKKVVALYYTDCNLNDSGIMSYPNFFSLRAATQDNRGKWTSHEVYSCTRCGFGRIVKRGNSSVTVQLQPEWLVHINPQDTPEEQEQWRKVAEKANTPFNVTLSLKDGRPVSSADPR